MYLMNHESFSAAQQFHKRYLSHQSLKLAWKLLNSLRLSDAYMHQETQTSHIGSDNGLLPDQHQAIIWTNAGKFLIGPLQ